MGRATKFLLLAVGIWGLAIGPVDAADRVDPKAATALIDKLGVRLVAALGNGGNRDEERAAALAELMREGLHLPTIGRFALGKWWRRASRVQRDQFQRVFADYVVSTTVRRFLPYRDIQFEIVGDKPVGRRDTRVMTLMKRADRPPVDTDWRVREIDGALRIIDVSIKGVSMVITQRDDFASVIAKSGIDGLIAQLQKLAQK